MINRILMELYDDYSNNNIESLIEFSKKTFPNDGTDKLFTACTITMFSMANGFKPRYDCNREELLDIVKAIKEKIGKSNLLEFYIDRVNEHKNVKKYFKGLFEDKELDRYADTIIDYLESFKPRFSNIIERYDKKIDEYLKSIENYK